MSALSFPTGWGPGPGALWEGPQGQGHVTDRWGNRGGLASGEWRREWPGGEFVEEVDESTGRPPPRVLPMQGC